MRAIVFSDLHVHDYKQFNKDHVRVDNTVNMLKYIFKFADKNEINHIFFTGDLFDQFANVSVIVINKVIKAFDECFKAYPDIEFIAISGNHDFATKNTFESPGFSGLDILSGDGLFTSFILLNGVYNHEHKGFSVMGIPYFVSKEHFWHYFKNTKDLIQYKDNAYLLMHQMVWPENPMVEDDVNLEDNRFMDFKWVFNGHVHHKGILSNNFLNVGSPIHRDASDIGIRKGIWIVDLEPGSDTLPKFWDTTERNPQYIQKAYGEPESDWEKQQYITWYHPDIKKQVKEDDFDSSKFNTELKPEELLTNFCQEVEPDNKDLLKAGLNLLL